MMLDSDQLNADCACVSLDRDALARQFAALTGDAEFGAHLTDSHPHLLSNLPVFLNAADEARMARLIATVEAVTHLPGYQALVRTSAPEFAPPKVGTTPGVFMGYDFHLGRDGPQLIEINTNAGGGLINALLAGAQTACCVEARQFLEIVTRNGLSRAAGLDAKFVGNFQDAFARTRPAHPLRTIAIVDDAPEAQYLYPEFVLFQRLFERHGLRAIIAAPEQLAFDGTALRHGETVIDLVYNRLTDFALRDPAHAAVAAAYRAGAAVVTPNPWVYALQADKLNLVRLTDAPLLRELGATTEQIDVLQSAIPKTTLVTAANAAALWDDRNHLFFKPCQGYGSRAAYRGDKITRKVWDHILAGGYVAQALVPPSTRNVIVDGVRSALKVDIRNFAYDGKVDLIAARLYQGQTTNFRTPGGGFAPVLSNHLGRVTGGCCDTALGAGMGGGCKHISGH